MVNRRNWLKQAGFGLTGLGLSTHINSDSFPDHLLAYYETTHSIIRLISNENPYGPSASARKAMAETIGMSNRYKPELADQLINALARKNKLEKENVLLAAGSSQVLDLMAEYVSLQRGSCVMPNPTFDYWSAIMEKNGIIKYAVPVTADKKINLQDILKAIRHDTRLVYICNPNNPTGTVCDENLLRDFVLEATKKTLVLVDEAYIDFSKQRSVCDMVSGNKNLVIARTFSKVYGLAGARIGYALAHPDTIETLSALTCWPNGSHSVVTSAAALASLQDEDFVQKTIRLIEQSKQYSITALEKMKLHCIPSATNFIYFSLDNYPQDYFEKLKKANILGTKIYEEQGKWTRISVGTQQEMEQFIHALT